MEDLPDVFVAEDEEEDARRQNVETQEEEISGRSKPKRPPALVYCSICKNDKNIRNKKRGFNSIDQFLIHRKRHAMQDAYARAPSLQRAKMECLIMGQETLSKLEETNLNRPIAQEMKRLAKLLKDNLFSDSVKQFFESMCDVFMSCFLEGRDFFLLSKLTEAYLSNVASKCADIEVRNNLLILLSPLVESSHINMFLASIMRHFSQLLLAFILRVMRRGENETINETSLLGSRYVERSENTDSEESMQTMHYIGGANVKKILRVALRLRNPNEKSLSIIDTIRSNFLIVDLAEDTDERLMAWTEAQDRGGLCKINKKVLNFFVLLGKAIQPLERADGSLIVSEVIEKVSTSCDIISVWDEIIAGKLSEEVSFELLYELVCHFCVTFRNGIISRRLDEWACDQSQRGKNNKHGTGGVSFRARLA